MIGCFLHIVMGGVVRDGSFIGGQEGQKKKQGKKGGEGGGGGGLGFKI